MLYTFAIEPNVLVTWDKCRNTLNLMGFQHGRAIAAYPSRKKWKALVRAACRENMELADHDRKRIFRRIDQSNRKFVSSEAAYDDKLLPADERWIRNAVANQTVAQVFHAILSTRNPDDHPDVVLEEDIDETHEQIKVQREAPVLREPSALTGHIGTLVRNSRELLLIDPHFNPSVKKWRPVMGACIRLAGQSTRDTPSVEIHTLAARRRTGDNREPPSLRDFRSLCMTHMPAMLSGSVSSIRICRWRLRDSAPDDFHARYVLTDRGGYRLDKGLDEEPGVEQSVELLSDQTWKRLREGFSDTHPVFDKDGEFTVAPPPPAA